MDEDAILDLIETKVRRIEEMVIDVDTTAFDEMIQSLNKLRASIA
jgi:hypothetical protein